MMFRISSRAETRFQSHSMRNECRKAARTKALRPMAQCSFIGAGSGRARFTATQRFLQIAHHLIFRNVSA